MSGDSPGEYICHRESTRQHEFQNQIMGPPGSIRLLQHSTNTNNNGANEVERFCPARVLWER